MRNVFPAEGSDVQQPLSRDAFDVYPLFSEGTRGPGYEFNKLEEEPSLPGVSRSFLPP